MKHSCGDPRPRSRRRTLAARIRRLFGKRERMKPGNGWNGWPGPPPAGVREPRRPRPFAGAGAVAVPEPTNVEAYG